MLIYLDKVTVFDSNLNFRALKLNLSYVNNSFSWYVLIKQAFFFENLKPLTLSPLIVMVLTLKSTPIVAACSASKASSVNLEKREKIQFLKVS